MRTLAALATLLALAAHAAAVSPADVKKQGVAKVVITSSSPPHGFLARTGEQGVFIYDLAQNRPTLFGNPRLVRFGLRASF